MRILLLKLVLGMYIFLTFYLFLNQYITIPNPVALHFFIPDAETLTRNDNAISSDANTNTIFITRIFHNKITAYAETFSISIARNLDPVFLFSLSDFTVMYGNRVNLKGLYPFELLLLFICLVISIRRKKLLRVEHYFLSAYIFSLLFIGVTLPYIHPIKLFLLMLVIRSYIVFMCINVTKGQVWFKK